MFKVANIPYPTKPNIYCTTTLKAVGDPRRAGPITMGRP